MTGARAADLLVVGAGVAGLAAAITAADAGASVIVLRKGSSRRGAPVTASTAYAQGGIAVVDPADDHDSVALHVADTVAAGGPLVDGAAAESLLGEGYSAVTQLIGWGAQFDSGPDGALRRTREGGHSVARIIHAGGDATGWEVQRALEAAAAQRTTITIVDDAAVTSLLQTAGGRVVGAASFAGEFHAPIVLLATGGSGHLYRATTNPSGATGDGIALADAAGADIRELDFIQFHPTMLYTPRSRGRCALVSEAVRGEGGKLLDLLGNSVMAGVHPLGDLAPRDVVSRAVVAAMNRTHSAFVHLDARGIADVEHRFPTISAAVREIGLSLADDLIPVTPGAHYQCGGVATDLTGATTVPGLYAAGEVARTGLHGANRLASNSLLEGLVMGRRVGAVSVQSTTPSDLAAPAAGATATGATAAVASETGAAVPIADRGALQDAMTQYAGVVRTPAGLANLLDLLTDTGFAPRRVPLSQRDFEDAALTTTARVLATQAYARAGTGNPTRVEVAS